MLEELGEALGWPRGLRSGSAAGLNVGSNPAGVMDVCLSVVSVVCCASRGSRDVPIPRPWQLHQVSCA